MKLLLVVWIVIAFSLGVYGKDINQGELKTKITETYQLTSESERTFDVTLYYFDSIVFSVGKVKEALERINRFFQKDCPTSFGIGEIKWVKLSGDKRWRRPKIDDDSDPVRFGLTNLAKKSSKSNSAPRIYFIDEFYSPISPGKESEFSSPASVVGKDHPAAGAIWITSRRALNWVSIAHELGHIILNEARHDNKARENFMSSNPDLRKGEILPIQCLLMANSRYID